MKPSLPPYQFIVEELADEFVVYDPRQKKAHNLNRTLAWIWRQCDGKTGVKEISSRFEREFTCSGGSDLVEAGLEQLRVAGLLEPLVKVHSLEMPGALLSRRAALASGSALVPLIATIFVPTAAAAKSAKDP